ncbi:MAG: alpha-galactosidase [Geminicoccaceae bacterium]
MRVWSLQEGMGEIVLVENPGGVPVVGRMGHAFQFQGAAPDSMEPALHERAVPNASLDKDVPPRTLVTTGGEGAFGTPSIAGSRADGTGWLLAFATKSVVTADGRMTVRLADERNGLELSVVLSLPAKGQVVEQTLTLRNNGSEPFRVDRLMAQFFVPGGDAEVITLAGRWGMEFQERRERLGVATWSRINRRGRTSHDVFPGVILGTETDQPLLQDRRTSAFHLAWSGNSEILIEPLDDSGWVIQLGEHWLPGEVILQPGEAATTPTALMRVPSARGPATGHAFHRYLRDHVLSWPGTTITPRPVTLNTWEGNYFDLDETRLRAQAEAAAKLGIERFVLDDGWFGRRDDDTTSLGDWTPHPVKFPHGLRPLAEHVRRLGMEFGLWVEPEMVSPDSDLFRAHPEWALQVQGRPLLTGRKQLVLDLGRAEVVDHLFTALDEVLRGAPISYLKWDMNRDLTAAGDATGRPGYRKHVLGLYALLDRLRAAHPEVEIESCASGGGRADYGILRRTHRIWTSDGTDPLTRIAIQRGFLRFFPPEIMGAHVSASPNHQTGRTYSLAFRAIVALPGHFGVELDPLRLDDAERAELAGWIALHKRLRPLLHRPGIAIQDIPDQSGRSGWAFIDEDATVLILVQERQQETRIPPPLWVPLHPSTNGRFRLSLPAPQRPSWPRATATQKALLDGSLVLGGGELGRFPLQLPELAPQSGLVILCETVKE